MTDPTTITVILALIGILKGKDIWEYLKSRSESKNKGNEKVIEIYETQIADLKNEIKELKNKNCDLVKRLEGKMLKSRGKKKDETNF
jgi:predicted RNase H-like nuclease (RuvC/YqgF family)